MLYLGRFKTSLFKTYCYEIKDIQHAACLPVYAIV